jgi:hypothetical protein
VTTLSSSRRQKKGDSPAAGTAPISNAFGWFGTFKASSNVVRDDQDLVVVVFDLKEIAVAV